MRCRCRIHLSHILSEQELSNFLHLASAALTRPHSARISDVCNHIAGAREGVWNDILVKEPAVCEPVNIGV